MRRMPTMNKISITDFLASIDRVKMQDELNLITQVVTRAKREGKFPSAWFIPIRDWCAVEGSECPEHLFKWHDASPKSVDIKQIANQKTVDQPKTFQGEGKENLTSDAI